ncbi:MAG TPA: hypothetical protein VNQ76_20520, partial [Planctomicrobium sp.]|nr:hypothetical protein [Planctomicrobium sp.]
MNPSVTILQTRWGFDGRIQHQTFLPLSIYVRNERPQPWTGTFSLKRVTELNASTGAAFECSVRLKPLESRWVQIFPFVRYERDQWTLNWFDGEPRSVTVDVPFAGGRANVLIANDPVPAQNFGYLPTLPVECFPDFLAGLDGLGVLFLDDVPRWSPQQAQACMDWLTGGGQVVLLHNAENSFPVFDEVLSSLNRRGGRFHVGGGTVFRVARKPGELNESLLEAVSLRQNSSDIHANLPAIAHAHYKETYSWNRHQWVLGILASYVTFERNWGVLSFVVILYFLLLFPVCYRIGYRQKNVKWFYMIFSSGVVLFSVLFWGLGQLGAGAQSRIASAVLARGLGSGRFDVTTWSQLASVSGGTELLRYPGEGLCYTYPENQEQLPGLFRNGEQGEAEIRFRPVSSVALLHRAVQVQNRPDPTILNFSTDGPVLSEL